MKYYSDPDEMAVEFYSNMQKQNNAQQIKQTIDNIHLLAKRNMSLIVQNYNQGLTDETLSNISERLRNTSIIVALIKYKFKEDEKMIKQKLKIVGQTIYEVFFLIHKDFTILTKLTEWCNNEESCQKNKVKTKQIKIDIHLVSTLKAYIEYINKELGMYFTPK